MKRVYLVILALCTSMASEIMAGSGKSWGIGLGAGAAGYMLGRSQGSKQREPRYTEVVTVQPVQSTNLNSQLESEQNRCRQLRKDVEELEEKNKRLDRKLERIEDKVEELEKENKILKKENEALKAKQSNTSKSFFN
jgi:TolA-binding protein